MNEPKMVGIYSYLFGAISAFCILESINGCERKRIEERFNPQVEVSFEKEYIKLKPTINSSEAERGQYYELKKVYLSGQVPANIFYDSKERLEEVATAGRIRRAILEAKERGK